MKISLNDYLVSVGMKVNSFNVLPDHPGMYTCINDKGFSTVLFFNGEDWISLNDERIERATFKEQFKWISFGDNNEVE